MRLACQEGGAPQRVGETSMLMECRNHPDWQDHEEVHSFRDEQTGLHALLAIHRVGALGVAGGGCRMWPFSTHEEALRDVLRLSSAMTYKLALAGIRAGGGKCVVIADPKTQKNDALLESLGGFIHTLQGRFVVGGDVGIDADDLRIVARSTPYVELGSHGRDTVSEATAHGVYWAMRAASEERSNGAWGPSLSVAIQGVGKVGSRLAELLASDGVRLVVSDVDASVATRVAERVGATVAPIAEIATREVDVLAPCALGDVLTARSVEQLRCRCVVGSANNQLSEPGVARALVARNITYVPDFVANMGGTLAGAQPHSCATPEAVHRLTERIRDITRDVLRSAQRDGTDPHRAAVALAQRRLDELSAPVSFPRTLAIATFQRLWRQPAFARSALRARAWVEELRGRATASRPRASRAA